MPTRQPMPLRAVLILTLLGTSAVPSAEPARSGLWEALSQRTSGKESPERGQGGRPGRAMANPKEGVRDGLGHLGNFLEKLAPLSRGLQPRLSRDSDGLRRLIRTELESLRVKLSPTVDEGHLKVGEHLADLRSWLQPCTEELLDQVSLKARELQRHLMPSREVTARLLEGAGEVQRLVAHYADELALHTERVKATFHPYAERLVTEIHRNVEELRRNVGPHSRASPEQLQRHSRELSARLTHNARDLHRKIQRNLERLKEQLREQLSPQPGRPQRPPATAEELAREVQRRVEQFRRDTHLQVQGFTRALDLEAVEMRLKLSCCPGEPQGGAPALRDLPARLDALWRDLARSLSERGGEGQ